MQIYSNIFEPGGGATTTLVSSSSLFSSFSKKGEFLLSILCIALMMVEVKYAAVMPLLRK